MQMTLIFIKANEKELLYTKISLVLYTCFSGLQINYDKSMI